MNRALHVSINGNDLNPGTASEPYRTISAAANVARPGNTVEVHAGEYREWVRPVFGGESDTQRVVYQAAPGEVAVIKGSERIENWEQVEGDVWKAVIPNSLFGEYNPYRELLSGDWFIGEGRDHHTGDVYLNGDSLFEVESMDKVVNPVPWDLALFPERSVFTWYCESNDETTTIWANFQGADPHGELVEINARPACFFPEKTGINYITVRGFEMCHAATQWAPPTAFQSGLIGPHWSKGWIIEDNVIHDSRCSGISLGKEISTGQNPWTNDKVKHGTQCQREVVFNALQIGWSKENIGSHIVRNNTIYDCEQTGICGHLGAVFSEISGNHIYNIHRKAQFRGAEIAGIKLHAPIDTLIKGNHIHHAKRGFWMDWQTQGTRITGNLLYENSLHDLFVEVSHGPFVVDNNIMLSPVAIRDMAQGGAFAHNLITGIIQVSPVPNRFTAYHFPHSTAVAGLMTTLCGDDRYYNNIFAPPRSGKGAGGIESGLSVFDEFPLPTDEWCKGETPDDYAIIKLPVSIASNLYLNGSKKYAKEEGAVENAIFDEKIEIETKEGKTILHIALDESCEKISCPAVTSDLLGKAFEPDARFENPDGSALEIDSDYLGQERSDSPRVGPFENLKEGVYSFTVWKI